MTKVYFGADHAGFALKQALIPFVQSLGYETEDKGAFELNPEDDYPDFILPVAFAVGGNPGTKGVVIGGSGQGEAIAANRVSGVRAIVFNGQYAPADGRSVPEEIVTAREHNDANVLSLGARFLSEAEAKQALELWLKTDFSGDERHARRLKKIEEMTKK